MSQEVKSGKILAHRRHGLNVVYPVFKYLMSKHTLEGHVYRTQRLNALSAMHLLTRTAMSFNAYVCPHVMNICV